MSIELPDETRKVLIASIQRYFDQNMDEPIGNLAAGALLGYVLQEIGPTIYNKAVADAQSRMQARIAELDLEVYEDELTYWNTADRKKKVK